MWHICRKFSLNSLFQFIIQHITFTDGNNELFVEEFGVILFKFVN